MYIGNDLSRGRVETYYYTSTSGGETAITTATDGKAINYTPGWVSVFLNGVRLHDSDFTATSGNSITGLVALTKDDVVIIEAQHTFSASDAMPSTGGTFSGNVSFGDNNITNVGSIALDSISADGSSITLSSNTTASGNLTITGDIVPSSQFSNRNVIYNGGMQIYQRGAGAPATNNGGFALDRWRYATWGSPGVVTVTQDSDVPSGQGFSSSLKMDVTTADASPAAGDSNGISMKFEGKDLQRFAKGVSGAKASTVSFWVKSPKTGVHIVWLYDNDNNRQISKSYTIASANTWENHSVTFAGDTTGAWGNDVNESAQLTFLIMSGTSFTSGTLATSWASYDATHRAVGQVNCMDNTANNFYLTGVQWEVGSNATPYEHRSYGEELTRCERYYQKSDGDDYRALGYNTKNADNKRVLYTVDFRTVMRASPAIVTSDGGTVSNIYLDNWGIGNTGSIASAYAVSSWITKSHFTVGMSSTVTTNEPHNVCRQGFTASAEL